MTDKKESPAKNKLSADWLVRGVLTKLGDTFDKLTGRDWKPSSSLATSELIERLKRLLDAEVREGEGGRGRFVPHNIKLKMQWDKFSTDSEDGLRKLENELLTAAIDHINDNLYHTHAPIKVEVKPDYFTEGVKLLASFDEFGADEKEVELNVTVPQMKVSDLIPADSPASVVAEPEPETEDYVAEFTVEGKRKSVELNFTKGKRLSVGRTKENNLSIDDTSVSKHHATLMVNPQGKFLVADTGSTNGTFINGERIAYGRAFAVSPSDRVKFGSIEVFFRQIPKPTTFVAEEEEFETEVVEMGNQQSESTKGGSAPAPIYNGGDEVQESRTENYQTDGYRVENDDFKRSGDVSSSGGSSTPAESRTIGTGLVENQPVPKEPVVEEEEDYTNGKHEDEEGVAPLTKQGIKLNFGDDQ